jgi:hypothetical protein
MHLQRVYKEYRAVCNGVSEKLFQCGICLPSGQLADAEKVVEVIASVI